VITLRKSGERGYATHGWLESWHTFSFAGYHDPAYMGFSALRVINEDIIAPGTGFGMHSHQDMEIVTYVLQGALRHRDSLGNGSVIAAGEVQRMSAGSGIRHSEFNASSSEPVHLLQIWILPDQQGVAPGYEQKPVPAAALRGAWRIIASKDGRNDSLTIHQDALLLATRLEGGEQLDYRADPERRLYLHLAAGTATLNGLPMQAGDGALIENQTVVTLSDAVNAEALLFDLP
jgi:redox-sensitive bicupin YhaK (pirin superfamily)